jgi:hypothetical protein
MSFSPEGHKACALVELASSTVTETLGRALPPYSSSGVSRHTAASASANFPLMPVVIIGDGPIYMYIYMGLIKVMKTKTRRRRQALFGRGTLYMYILDL